jgi:hypothetical protein
MKIKRKMINFFTLQVMEHRWNEIERGKPVPVPLCPPQIPHGLTRDRTRASPVGRQPLTSSQRGGRLRAVNRRFKSRKGSCGGFSSSLLLPEGPRIITRLSNLYQEWRARSLQLTNYYKTGTLSVSRSLLHGVTKFCYGVVQIVLLYWLWSCE